MGLGSLISTDRAADEKGGGSWALSDEHAKQVQGIVVSSFPHLNEGAALFLELPPTAGGAWLNALRAEIPITPATGKMTPSAAIAFTYTGLQAMKLDSECLATFAQAFREGMRQSDRHRRLGDDGRSHASATIWSANVPDDASEDGRRPPRTDLTVHAVLLLYHVNSCGLEDLEQRARRILDEHCIKICRRRDHRLVRDAAGEVREHFGFVDGISQPVPHGPEIVRNGEPAPRDPWHGVPVGDVLLGHRDADGEFVLGPVVRSSEAGADELLPEGRAPLGHRDLGLDGAYMVIRELRQDVATFRRSLKEAAEQLKSDGCDADWLAERMVGRTRDGRPLRPVRNGGQGAQPKENAFGYIGDDAHGQACPLGSHVRRANPRDGLAPTIGEGPVFLQASNNHRILRRGRSYGLPYDDDPSPDADRGTLFIAINTDFARQFEFIQQTWVLNQDFATLFDETDPLVGVAGPFTVPKEPLRLRIQVESYVTLQGGDYFFLPSLAALNFLAHPR